MAETGRLPALGGVICLALAGIAILGDLRERLVPFILLFGLAFGAYLAVAWLVLRAPALTGGRRLWPLLGMALAMRLVLLPVAPTLSDDLYRYVWEGRVLLAGFSPYRYAPDAPALASLRDDAIWAHVNNLDTPSPYPPLAQLGGVLGAALTPTSPLGVKLIATLADLAVIPALVWLLAAAGQSRGRVLLYAWHPLVILSFSHSGHNDALMLAPLVLALSQFRTRARGGGPEAGARLPSETPHRASRHVQLRTWGAERVVLLIALAGLAKIVPLLLLPVLLRRLGLAATVLLGVVIALAWLPLLLLGSGATGSLLTYLGAWADNDALHALLRLALGASGAKVVCSLLLLVGLVVLALHPRLARQPLWWQAYVAFGLSLLVASTVHAWYLTWLAPLLAVHMRASERFPFFAPLPALGWLLFSGLVALPYLTYDTHVWQLWISVAEYLPLAALLLAGLLRSQLKQPHPLEGAP